MKSAMYDEAVSTFDTSSGRDRPVKEILYADYTFLNKPLATFYGIDRDLKLTDKMVKVDGANAFNRGGALRLGAVLTTTSAPLRTSPVKRGDWVLRRILGTPTPPPPADAGTIPADDKTFNGLTVRERAGAAQAQRDVRQLPPAHRSARISARRVRCGRPPARRIRRRQTGRRHRRFADETTIVGADGLLNYLQTQDKQVMTTLSKKMLGYALGRTVTVRSAADREHDGGRGRCIVRRSRATNRDQPSVPQHRSSAARNQCSTAREQRTSLSESRYPTRLRERPSRRHFLRGMGVALALPWMESLPVFGQAAEAVKANTPPLRLGIVFFSNGVEPTHWWAKGSGADMEFGPAALPMMPHREDMVFIQGLFNQTAFVSTSPHLGRMNVLSGAPVSLDPNEIRVGTSMDQVLASQIGGRTAIPSLVLGIEPNELRLEDGLSMIYGSSLSWVSPTKPATKEIYPVARLRSAGRRRHRPQARSQHPRRGPAGLAEPRPKISRGDNVKLTSISSRSATSRSGSSAHRRKSASRAGGRRCRSPTCRGRRTSCRRTCPIT